MNEIVGPDVKMAEEIGQMREAIKGLAEEVKRLRDCNERLTEVTGALAVRFAAFEARVCPSPGECLRLRGELAEMKAAISGSRTKLDGLALWKAEVSGKVWGAAAVASAVWAGALSALQWFIKKGIH